ncbi:MAG: hypothetical protein IJZ25_04770, partial [Lachnospiraceae bacterium]|nr:hypothetical protein [Lachnospiraceae bacterium]
MTENNTEEQVIDTQTTENGEEQVVAEENVTVEEVKNETADKGAAPETPVKEAKKTKKKVKHDKRDDEIAELKDRITRNLAEF